MLMGLSALILCAPLEAWADAIIPYMAVPLGQVFLLPIVILIEGIILRKLAGGRTAATFFQSFVGNVASTAIGAAIYFVAIPPFGEQLFYWWFKGGFGSEALRNALIAFAFAFVLYTISWSCETMVIARIRRVKFKNMMLPCAWANLFTYVLLLGCAVLIE
jgi:hypothetical protein